jgi:hypothetical protein
MISLSQMTNEHLLNRFHKLIATERKITHLIIATLAEIDRRKLYLEMAYPNLFSFLVEGVGYSAAAAMRRIDGARLLREIPEIAEKLETGSINLTQVSKLQQAVRQAQKKSEEKISSEIKLEILEKLESTTEAKTQKILEEILGFQAPTPQSVIHHRDNSVTLTITFSAEEMEKLEEARNLVSHAVSGSWSSVLSYLAKKEIHRRKGRISKSETSQSPD